MDRSFISIKGSFHKSMTHSDVLAKCTEYARGVTEVTGQYYLSDGSGCKITDEDLTLRFNDCEDVVPWTLANYMKACNTYASRTRLYSVFAGKNDISVLVEGVKREHVEC